MNRNDLIEDLAHAACESTDLKELLRLYYDDQVDYMSSLTDLELVDLAVSMGKDPMDLAEDYEVPLNIFKDDEDLADE